MPVLPKNSKLRQSNFLPTATPSFLDPFLKDDRVPFHEIISADFIQAILDKHASQFGNTYHAVYTPLLTLWMVLWQLLSDASCAATVAVAIVYCETMGVKVPGVDVIVWMLGKSIYTFFYF
ncbi:MAG: hypothetical protein LBC20_02070 [Planctomycetaceae bacterium]|jgi:hypothetical protein|nr:hypothetical protein [Planctomycetaceae bacterium]